MVYSLILFVTRKPGLSLHEFKYHWETNHIPLLKDLVGQDFPLSHTRHYLDRDTSLPGAPVTALFGAQEHFTFDGVGVLTFINRDHYESFHAKLKGEAQKMHDEDLAAFVDITKLKGVFVGDSKSSGRDGGVVGWRFVGSV
ncbi:hypothetical protein BDV96DRAFT_653415 [Lophiotrema nucula]|uniref:EthD domain-containing protein n=1 Tax=Lophiotrema nucula TaxID=690887 RepID=A0A6A5YMJ2_9PLEO|nr:hypothetical protein BDV96DRAFT_653415 [Lophiotrema nucula]